MPPSRPDLLEQLLQTGPQLLTVWRRAPAALRTAVRDVLSEDGLELPSVDSFQDSPSSTCPPPSHRDASSPVLSARPDAAPSANASPTTLALPESAAFHPPLDEDDVESLSCFSLSDDEEDRPGLLPAVQALSTAPGMLLVTPVSPLLHAVPVPLLVSSVPAIAALPGALPCPSGVSAIVAGGGVVAVSHLRLAWQAYFRQPALLRGPDGEELRRLPSVAAKARMPAGLWVAPLLSGGMLIVDLGLLAASPTAPPALCRWAWAGVLGGGPTSAAIYEISKSLGFRAAFLAEVGATVAGFAWVGIGTKLYCTTPTVGAFKFFSSIALGGTWTLLCSGIWVLSLSTVVGLLASTRTPLSSRTVAQT